MSSCSLASPTALRILPTPPVNTSMFSSNQLPPASRVSNVSLSPTFKQTLQSYRPYSSPDHCSHSLQPTGSSHLDSPSSTPFSTTKQPLVLFLAVGSSRAASGLAFLATTWPEHACAFLSRRRAGLRTRAFKSPACPIMHALAVDQLQEHSVWRHSAAMFDDDSVPLSGVRPCVSAWLFFSMRRTPSSTTVHPSHEAYY